MKASIHRLGVARSLVRVLSDQEAALLQQAVEGASPLDEEEYLCTNRAEVAFALVHRGCLSLTESGRIWKDDETYIENYTGAITDLGKIALRVYARLRAMG